jgi:ABC-type polysaccharide/polyol phosphate export permease
MVYKSIGTNDICNGCLSYWLWLGPAISEIKNKYSRSIIGPFWQTIAVIILVLSLGPLYSLIYSIQQVTLIPYISIGFVLWIFIVSFINEVCYCFINAEAELKSFRIFYSVYILKCLVKNILIFLHSFIALVIILPFYIDISKIKYFDFILGLTLLFLALFFLGLILAILGTRFRDFPQITSTSMQFFFFLTPILWIPDFNKSFFYIINFNPFFIFIELIRNPLLGNHVNFILVFLSIFYLLILFFISLYIFNKKYNRIIFWL